MTLPDPIDVVPRRGLLRMLVGGLSATAGLLLYPVARFLRPKSAQSSGGLEAVAPYKVNDLRADAEGKWIPPFNFGGKPCLIVKTPDGDIRAFNAVCSHVDCTVAHRPSKGDMYCSCHGGVYDLNGKNVSGPPPRPLEMYKVTLKGKPGQEEIIVTRNS